MNTLFKIDEKNKIVFGNETLKLLPDLKNLTQKQLLWIILVHDSKSPYRLLDPNERKIRANRLVYGVDEIDMESLPETFKKGQELYESLMFDERRNTIDTFRIKKRKLEADLIYEESANRIDAIIKSIKTLDSEIIRLTADLNRDEDHDQLVGGSEMTFLEKYMDNIRKKKEYKNSFVRKPIHDISAD